jgi:hypothetical protein
MGLEHTEENVIRKRNEDTAAEVTAQDEDQAVTPVAEAGSGTGGPVSPPGDFEPPDELAARAEQMNAEADRGSDYAAEKRAQAQELIRATEERHAAEMAAVRREAGEIGRDADRREREAHDLGERGRLLGHATATQRQAIDAAVQATALADERERLAEQMAELDDTLTRLRGEKQDADAQLTAARDSADVDLAAAQQSRVGTLEGVLATQTAKRSAAQSRFTQIGDGTDSFPGLLADALRTAQTHHLGVRRALNAVWPDRPAAVKDRQRAEWQAIIDAQYERIAEEAKAKPPQRQIVHL